MPLALNLEDCRLGHYDRGRVLELFQQFAFSSLIGKLPRLENEDSQTGKMAETVLINNEPEKCEYLIINTPELLNGMLAELVKAGDFAFDTETTGLDLAESPIVGLSFSAVSGKAFYIPIGHIGWEQTRQMEASEVAGLLRPVMEDESVVKIAHNAKFDMEAMERMGVKVRGLYFDTMIAAYLLGEKALGLKDLAFNRLGVEMTPIKELIGTGAKQINMSQVEISAAYEYACKDADVTLRLAHLFTHELKDQNLYKLFADVEMPLLPVLVDMENAGIMLDTALLEKLSHRLAKRLIELESNIYNDTGHRFNINSPPIGASSV